MNEAYPNQSYSVKNDFVRRMKEIIEISLKSVKTKLNINERNFSFEIFGYDFIMDADFNIYLLEINTNPGLEESSPLIKILVPRMIDDALRLTIDDICETKYSFSPYFENETLESPSNNNVQRINPSASSNNLHSIKNKDCNDSATCNFNSKETCDLNDLIKSSIYISPYPVDNYSDSENIWELVCDLNEKEKPEKSDKYSKEKRGKRSKSKAKNH